MNGSALGKTLIGCETGVGLITGDNLLFMNPALQSMIGLHPSQEMLQMAQNELAQLAEGRELLKAIETAQNNTSDALIGLAGAVCIGGLFCDVRLVKTVSREGFRGILLVTSVSHAETQKKERSVSVTELYHIVHDLKAPVRALRNLAEWIDGECRNLEGSGDLREYVALLGSSVVELNDRIELILKQTRR